MGANIILQTGGGLPFETWKKIFGDSTPHQVTYDDLRGVTELRPYAFYASEDLTYIELPCTISYIGAHAFNDSNASNLTIKYEGLQSTWEHIPKDPNWIGGYENSVTYIFTQSTDDQNIEYDFNGSGKLMVRASASIPSSKKLIVLPEYHDGYQLYGIFDNGFAYKNGPESLALPYGIEYIGNGSFINCGNLKYINIPNSVLTIAKSAFANAGIKSLYIPASVEHIGNSSAVEGFLTECDSLESLVNYSPCTLYKGSLRGCENLKTIELCNLSIGGAPALFGLLFYPSGYSYDNMLSIIQYDYNGNTYETQIPSDLTTVIINDDHVYTRTFSNCSPIKYVTINNAVDIEDGAFLNCVNLEYLKLSNTLTDIGSYVFDGCSKLKYIIYDGTKSEWNLIAIDNDCFNNSSVLYIECSDGVINL